MADRHIELPVGIAFVAVGEPLTDCETLLVGCERPLTAAFGGKGFRLADEFYELQAPYDRTKLRVLLSVDNERMKGVEKVTKYGKPVRTDGDYGLSWVKPYGKGRVFYCALGHAPETYWNPAMLRHFLDGIQFALGDLPADAAPK